MSFYGTDESGPSVGISFNFMGQLIGGTFSIPAPFAFGVSGPNLPYFSFLGRYEGTLAICYTALFGNTGDSATTDTNGSSTTSRSKIKTLQNLKTFKMSKLDF